MAVERVLYWDASAILAVLVQESHTRDARRQLTSRNSHLVSSLAQAEVMAVLARMEKEGRAGENEISSASKAFGAGPWRRLGGAPRAETIEVLSPRHSLRGADLWHLAMAVDLRGDLPELRMLSYDKRLTASAAQEGL